MRIKYVKVALLTSFCLVFLPGMGQLGHHKVVVPSSSFSIHGQTNVNEFECLLKQEYQSDVLNVSSEWTDYTIKFEGLKLKYKVDDFNCEVPGMDKDLKSTLKSKEFPYLHLQIIDIQIDPNSKEIEHLEVMSNVIIKLAGQTRKVLVKDGYVINYSESELALVGTAYLKMTDFAITPPTKFFGLVQVTDELKVHFQIDMIVKSSEQ